MATKQQIIRSFMGSLDNTTLSGASALNEAVKACSSFKNANDVITKLVNDCKAYNQADSTNGWKNFLKEKCGINLDNTDTGAITGSDAGGSKSKNPEDIVPESGVIDTSFNKNSFVVDNLTIKLGKRDSNDNAVSRSFSDLSTYEKYLWQSLKSYWVKGGLDLIAQSYGNKFSFSSTNVTSKTLYVIFIDEGRGGALATTYGGPKNAKKCTNDLKLHINLYYYGDAYGKDGKVTNGEEHLDRTIAHELTHAVMRSNIDYFDKLPAFIKEGMAELTHGIDDSRSDSIETLAKNSSLLSKALSMSTDKVKISGVSSPSYSAGYIFLRYLAKQSAESAGLNFTNYTENTVLSGTSYEDTIKNIAGGMTIKAGAGNDSIYSSTDKNYTIKSAYGYVTIDGGAGNDNIYSNDPNVSINGGADNDYIYSKSSNVTIRGGSGSDSITNYSRNSRIYGEDNNDTITNYAGGVTIQGGTGNDFIKSSTDKNYTVKSAYGYVTIDAGAGADSIDNNDSYVSINGGADNDKISVGSYSNVTVVGGTGNDTIYGNRSGYGVLYRYNSGDGNDIISAINNNDTISITGGKYQKVTLSSSSDVTLKVGTGSMILKNAKDKKYTVKGTLDGGNKISLTSGNNTYNSTVSNKMIYALAGNDKIKNTAGKVTIYGGAGNDSIENRIGNVLIYGDNDNDSILNTSTNVTINGGAGADTIENHSASKGATIHGDSGNDLIKNNGSNIRIYGDSGSDKISIGSSASNVTVIGGADNDTIYSNGKGNVFQYASGDGKDFISGYTSKDTIKITSGSISKATVSGNNVVFTVGTGTITVKDGKDKAITVVDSSGKKTSATYPTLPAGLSVTSNDTKLTVNKNYASTAVDLSKYASTIKIVDASVLTKNIKISGGKNAMSIIGGSGADTLIGGAKADTLNGGAGNDTLTGGAGNDVFLYGTGKDVITDYTAGQDKIKILSGKISKTSYSGQNVIFTIGSGTLTVKNGKGKKITIVDANNKTTTKTYSGTSQTSGLLYEDDNFIDGETKLDAITEIQESNYLLGKNDTVTAEDELEQLHKYDFKFSGQN